MSALNQLHARALEVAKKYNTAQSELIEILQKLDQCKGFIELGYTSLSAYAVSGLKLSEDIAYTLISIARKSIEVPALKAEVQAGAISVSNARRIAPILTPQNQEQWLEKAKTLSRDKLEKELAVEFPKLAVKEKVTYVTETRMSLTLGLSEELMKKVKRVQDLESQRLTRHVSTEEALEAMVNLYIEKNDPIEKAKRASAREEKKEDVKAKLNPAPVTSESNTIPRPTKSPVPGRREHIPAHVEHKVMLRDKGMCQFTDRFGKKCQNSRWIDLHHRVPVNQGGANTVENIITLCSAHHRMVHTILGH